MGFFDTIKQWLGIGGVKVELQVAPQVARTAGAINGNVVLTSKSDQHVTQIKVKLVETWITGRGEEKSEKEYELGTTTVDQPFDLKAGESRTVTFMLPFQMLKSDAESLADKGGAMGMLGKAAMFANAEKSEFKIVADADVKGTALGPSDSKQIQMV